MRIVTLILIALIALVQVELWFGKGGMLRVTGLRTQLAEQQARNDKAQARNARLNAEVHDLQEGLEMVEEKARAELGMVKPDEIVVHVSPRK
ncbi:cell division protein FtsB [Rivibacter subsaxonicus]|uniref:Cell division protein FtsB n=1 Tax=Rivibacter subsaxonicus TaxID=457575 RepID=A0A4V2FTF9_9BURK|nr:cell division protein FtsB [Rivibacter subsaxonicus]RZT97705.1 cell division protein FtsB [Rivibacter subsaxonicus]